MAGQRSVDADTRRKGARPPPALSATISMLGKMGRCILRVYYARSPLCLLAFLV